MDSSDFLLAPGEAHVWYADAQIDSDLRNRLLELLSEDEWARADRFRFDQDRRRYIAAHGLLRILLGRYSDTPPRELKFQIAEHGKPFLPSDDSASELCFNESDSGEMI